ncbi:MAG: tRNA (guanosine(37)-N1)-methyltransferase TrmD [Bdellovibrionales bacterium]
MKIGVITLFPESIEAIKSKESFGLVGKAFEEGKAELFIENLRESGLGKHQVVDDTPYGGGDGMVLKPEPIEEAFNKLLRKMDLNRSEVKALYTCPSGELWTQKRAELIVKEGEKVRGLIILCGRYAGADNRVIEELFDERVSIGPFILNGGELPALCIMETIVRILPGVLGNSESIRMDSFSSGLLAVEAEPYTKPQSWKGLEVPEVLLSGDHKKIEGYRAQRSQKRSLEWLKKASEAVKSCLGEK